MKLQFITAILSGTLLYSSYSVAAPNQGLGVKAGTTGLGLEYFVGLSEHVGLRVGVNAFDYDDEFTENDIRYDAQVELKTASLIVDYHPWDTSTFRLSTGVFYNDSRVDAQAQAINGQYEFNGDVYQLDEVGSADGYIEFDKVVPYIGLGWSASPMSNSSWTLNFEVGAFYQNAPQAQLNVVCGESLSENLCHQLLADVQVEQDELIEDVKEYKWYPVVNLGLMYRF